MPATLNVTPYYNKNSGIASNYLSWTFSPSLPVEAEIIIFRSVGVPPDIDATDYNLIEIKRLKPSATSYIDQKIIEGLTYYYSVRGTNEDLTEYPATVQVTDSRAILDITLENPKNFIIKSYSQNSIIFEWSFNSSNKAPIYLEYSENNNFSFKPLVSNLAPNSTEYVLTNFNLKTSTFFRAYTSINDSGEKSYSNIVSLNTYFNNVAVPRPPEDLLFTPLTETTAKLTWTNTNEGAENLEHLIWISTPSGTAILYDAVLGVDENSASSIILEGLDSATNYCITCQARTAGGKSNFADAVTGITTSENQLPTAITNLTGINICEPGFSLGNFFVENSKVQRLSWINPAIELAATKELKYDSNSSFTTASSLFLNLTATSIDIPFLIPNTTYYYKIISENLVGSVSSSTFSLLLPSPPALPTGLSVTAGGSNTIFASWTDPTSPGDPDQEQFFIVQASGPAFGYNQDSVIVDSQQTTLTLTGLVPNSNYNIRVFSLGFGGVSGTEANWTSATVATASNQTVPPLTPTDLYFSGQVDPTTVICCFTDNATDEAGFEFAYGPVGTTPRVRYIPAFAGTGLKCETISNLIPNTTYNAALRSFKGTITPQQTGIVTAYSNGLANVSGSTDVILSFSTSPFVFNNESSAVSITNLTTSTLLVDDEFIPYVSGIFDDPYPNYGQGFEIFRVNDGAENSVQSIFNDEPRILYQEILGGKDGDVISFVVRKYVDTFGFRTYSSGIVSSIALSGFPTVPQFVRNDDPTKPPLDLFAYRSNGRTIVEWKDYENASSITLYRGSSDGTVIYTQNPATGKAFKYTDTFADYNSVRYVLVLSNQFYSIQREVTLIVTGGEQPTRNETYEEPSTEGSYASYFAVNNLQFVNSSRNLATITWEYETIPSEYGQTNKLFYFITRAGSLVTSGELTNMSTTSLDVTLSQGNDYLLSILGQNASFVFSKISFLPIFLTEPALTPPTNFRFSETTRQRVTLNWSPINFATGYIIRKITNANNNVTEEFINLNSTQLTYVDTNLILNSTVSYSIQAVSPITTSEFTNLLTYNVPDDPNPPITGVVVDAPRACPIQGVSPGNIYYRIRRS